MKNEKKSQPQNRRHTLLKIALVLSLALNLCIAAFAVYAINSDRYVEIAGNFFFGKTAGEVVEANGRSWGCILPKFTPEYAAKNQKFCYGVIVLDANNKEVNPATN